MTARANNVYKILDQVKNDIDSVCEDQGLSPLLMWLLVRQQADYELLKQQFED